MTQTQENTICQRAKSSALSQQVTTMLQGTAKAVWQRQTRKSPLFEKLFQEYIIRPNQTQRFVQPYLGPNCLQRLSAHNTCRQRVNSELACMLWISWTSRWMVDWLQSTWMSIMHCVGGRGQGICFWIVGFCFALLYVDSSFAINHLDGGRESWLLFLVCLPVVTW